MAAGSTHPRSILEVSMPGTPLRILVVFFVGMLAAAANAATFELARIADGTIRRGVKVEGDIVPGDAQRLLDFYKTYGVMASPIYLRSKGGNVEEAMRMGVIIRRLRLETRVPVWDTLACRRSTASRSITRRTRSAP